MDDHPQPDVPTGSAPAGSPAKGSNPPEAGALVVYSNLACPVAGRAVETLLSAREEHGLDIELVVDHRPLPPESISRPEGHPVPTRTAHEAVQAAKAQGPEASVRLDRALRAALHDERRPEQAFDPTDLHAIADLAVGVGLDRAELTAELRSGRPGADVRHHLAKAVASGITESPTIVTPGGGLAVAPDDREVEELVRRAATGVAAE
jgi:protein-disulfide isomerase